MKKGRRFVYLDHPADAKFRAYGRTMEEAFSHAALAVASLMWQPEKVKPRQSRVVMVQGKDLEQLLFKFLSEILYLFEAKGFLLSRVKELKIKPPPRMSDSPYFLEAVFEGDNLDKSYAIRGEVKAITYHEMVIKQKDGVYLQVVVDM